MKLIHISAVILLTAFGCSHVESTRNSSDSNGKSYGNYDFMHQSIKELSLDEHKKWETFYSESGELDWRPIDYSDQAHAFEDGCRSGYAYFKLNETEIIHSCMSERNREEEAYVHGWYDGQSKAFVELMSDSLKFETETTE